MPVFPDLTPDQKLELIEVLCDDLDTDVPVHDWQIEEVKRRRELFKKNPASALTWEDVEKRLRDRHAR